jgi:lipopolysaccharide transport system ATP-binding protein
MAVIQFNNVSKAYRLGAGRGSLREAISTLFRPRLRNTQELFWAVQDVSFDVQAGETLGIIGHNGAGKSTMLKLLARVTFPTRGQIQAKGRMAALIELGAGFHPDLSGRENIFLNGAMLGMKKREVAAQFDRIVDFAGLAQFIDTPVKRYSSGMYVRLAFAVASHVRSDLLLVDEVLSVGDMAFQEKSLARMRSLRDEGATVVFISHSLPAVRSFCSRLLLMNHGRVIDNGTPDAVIETYERVQREAAEARARQNATGAGAAVTEFAADTLLPAVTKIETLDHQRQPRVEYAPHDGAVIRAHYSLPDETHAVMYGLRVLRAHDDLTVFDVWKNDDQRNSRRGHGMFEVVIPQLLLRAGDYQFEIILAEGVHGGVVAVSPRVSFVVLGDPPLADEGVFLPEHSFVLSA